MFHVGTELEQRGTFLEIVHVEECVKPNAQIYSRLL